MIPILFILLNLLFAILILYLLIAFLTGAPYVPSDTRTADTMIRLSGIKKSSIIYDLGSGDGRLLYRSMLCGAKKAIGYEINPYLVLLSRIRFFFSPFRNRVYIYLKNFWKADISGADIVYIYLLPWRMKQLKKKLLSELKPGAYIVSNSFIFPHWKTLQYDEKAHVYVFKVPKRSA